jgi:hypothetical protein
MTFDVTLLREPYRASGGVFGGYRWFRKGLVRFLVKLGGTLFCPFKQRDLLRLLTLSSYKDRTVNFLKGVLI